MEKETSETENPYNNELESLCERLGCPEILTSCQKISLKVDKNNLYSGRCRKSILGGILMIALKDCDKPIPPQQVCDVVNSDVRSILLAKTYIRQNINDFNVLPVKWEVHLDEFCEYFCISPHISQTAFNIGDAGSHSGIISGRKPRCYAASCLYASLKMRNSKFYVTQSELEDVSETSKSAIRNTYKKLLRNYQKAWKNNAC